MLQDSAPLISVVIATYRRSAALQNCLECLARQTFPAQDFEVIVVDDGSPEPVTLAAAAPNVRLIRQEDNAGVGVARNAGVACARGPLLAFTDDDCLPRPDWLENLWQAHQLTPAAMLGGRVTNAVPDYLGAEASQVISDIVYSWYNADIQSSRFFSTNNVALPRGDFLQLSGFDARFRMASEDRDLCDRWLKSGRQMVFVPGAVIGHAHRLTVPRFFRQHFAYGRGAAVYHAARSERQTGRMRDEMPFHKALPRLAARRLRPYSPARRAALMLMLLGWQAANAGGYAWQRFVVSRRNGTN